VETGPTFEELKISLREPVNGLDAVAGDLGIPEWWPTGSRASVVLVHGATGDKEEPLIRDLHRALTERKYLCLRFNFPFAQAGKKRPDPIPVLQNTLRAAIAVLGRDPSAIPSHLLLLGKDLGASVIAHTAAHHRLRVEGIALLGYPLHPQGKPEKLRADDLFRIVCPTLFIQGKHDRQCDLTALRQTLLRVGAPTTLHTVEAADHNLKIPKKAERSQEDIHGEILNAVDAWIGKILGGV